MNKQLASKNCEIYDKSHSLSIYLLCQKHLCYHWLCHVLCIKWQDIMQCEQTTKIKIKNLRSLLPIIKIKHDMIHQYKHSHATSKTFEVNTINYQNQTWRDTLNTTTPMLTAKHRSNSTMTMFICDIKSSLVIIKVGTYINVYILVHFKKKCWPHAHFSLKEVRNGHIK